MTKFLTLFALIPVSLFAEIKFEQLSADKSMKASEREIIMTIPKLGMSSYKYKFDILFCPASSENSKPKCLNLKPLTGNVSPKLIDKILDKDINQLVSKRYDILKILDNNAEITTATKIIRFPLQKNLQFRFSTGSKYRFDNEMSKYLKRVAKTVQTGLNNSAKTRRNELSDKDEVSSIRLSGKSKALSISEAEHLKNTGYAFSLYYGKLRGQIIIKELIVKTSKGTNRIYNTSFYFKDSYNLNVYKFHNGKYTLYTHFTVKSRFGSRLYKDSMPSHSDLYDKLIENFSSKTKEAMITLNTLLKEDRNFKIISPLINVDGNDAEMKKGCQEDIRIDHPFMIERTVNNKSKILGFMKVRKSGINCQSKPLEKRENSIVTAITGNIEDGDLLLEHPWTGVFGVIQGGVNSSSFQLSDQDIQGGNFSYLAFSIRGDLGYIMNSSFLSEIWFEIGAGYGLGDDLNLTDFKDKTYSNQGFLLINLALAKRFYLGSLGIYSDFGLGLNYEASSYKFDSENSFGLSSLVADPFLRLGYNFSPNVELFGKVGYSVPIFTTLLAISENEDKTPVSLKDADENGNLSATSSVNFSFGLAIHTNFTGVFTKIFSNPPSSVCKVTRVNK